MLNDIKNTYINNACRAKGKFLSEVVYSDFLIWDLNSLYYYIKKILNVNFIRSTISLREFFHIILIDSIAIYRNFTSLINFSIFKKTDCPIEIKQINNYFAFHI